MLGYPVSTRTQWTLELHVSSLWIDDISSIQYLPVGRAKMARRAQLPSASSALCREGGFRNNETMGKVDDAGTKTST